MRHNKIKKLTRKKHNNMSRRGGGPKTQKSAEGTNFCSLNTGISSMEYIRGIGNQTRGTLAQVLFSRDFLHPVYSRTKDDEEAKLTLRDRINFGFFKNMTEQEKLDYIRNENREEKYFNDIVGCEIRFLSIGADFLKLPMIFMKNNKIIKIFNLIFFILFYFILGFLSSTRK